MQSKKDSIKIKIRSAFSLHDQNAKIEAIREILDLIETKEADMKDIVDDMITGIKQEKSSYVLSFIWTKLATMTPDEKIKSFAEQELDNSSPEHRRFALAYLATVYPEESRRLYEKMQKDNNAFVLFEAGKAILPIDQKLALNLWFSIIGISPHVLGDEIIPEYIAQYADAEFISYLERLYEENPDDKITEMVLEVIKQEGR